MILRVTTSSLCVLQQHVTTIHALLLTEPSERPCHENTKGICRTALISW